MAVYKLFPNKDTFIYSEIPVGNAGYDEMIEIGGYPVLDVGQTCRTLIQFETQEIQNVINNKAGGTPVAAYLNIKLASAYETPTSHSVMAYPMYEYWDGGVGKFADYPFDKSGCSWRYAKANMSGSWTLPHNTVEMPANVTGSYSSTYPGGGVW